MPCPVIRNVLTLLWLFIPAYATFGNPYALTRLSSNEGLSQHDVECILQDKQGFVWIGTYDGLNRFDGTRFTVFRHQPGNDNSISNNRILALAEWKERNELWIGTDGGGLDCYNLETGRFTHYYSEENRMDSLTDNQIICLYRSGRSMWIGTANGPHRLRFDAGNRVKIERFPLLAANGEPDPFQCTLSIADDNRGNTIAGTARGVYLKTPDDPYFRELKNLRTSVREILKDKTGRLWILSDRELLCYSPEQQKLSDYLQTPFRLKVETDAPLRRILPVTDRDYLLLSETKVTWIRKQSDGFETEPIHFSNTGFFAHNLLKGILLDRSMNVWLASNMDGTARFDLNAKAIRRLPLKHARATDKIYIQALVKDRKSRLWIGSSQGLFVYDLRRHTTIRIDAVEEDVYDILEDREHDLWVTSLHHIFYIPAGDLRRIRSIRERKDLPPAIEDFVGPYSLCADARNTIWVGMRNGLLQIKKNGNRFSYRLKNIQPYEAMGAVNNVTELYFHPERQSLLIGTKNTGLLEARLNAAGDITSIDPVDSGKEKHIWSIVRASDGCIYVGTDSGLRYLDTCDSLPHLRMRWDDIRLQTCKIAAMAEDNARNLWMNTSQGLVCYSPDGGQVVCYLNTDGLSTNILCEGILYDPEGFLYTGSIKGVDKIDLAAIRTNTIEPECRFAGLLVNNTRILPHQRFNGRVLYDKAPDFLDKLALKHNENNFTIEFAALHFSNPAKNKFRYRLEGFSRKWAEVDSRVRAATFTNVPPGTYRLQMKSANCDGLWNDTPQVLTIVVASPPWATGQAYAGYLFVFSLLAYLVVRYIRERQHIKRQLAWEHLEHNKALEIAEVKLKYHTNITHELRTPLSLTSAPAEELLKKSYPDDFLNSRLGIIKNNADRLLQLIDQFLDFRKVVNDKYAVRIRYGNLSELLSEVRGSFLSMAEQKNIVIEFYNDLEEETGWFDKDVIRKICSNLLSNALKHTPPEGRIILYATQHPDGSHVSLSIEDTGNGIEEKELEKIFDRFYQVPGTTGGTGIGLNLCKQLITLHRGTIAVKSRLGEGTVFTIGFPVNKDAFHESMVVQEDEARTDKPEPAEEATGTIKAGKKIRILVVEDHAELRDYMVSLLKEDPPAEIFAALNGQEGYDLAVSHIPDLIISDIMMPGIDGIELTRKCKTDSRISHVPVILLTAKAGRESEIEGLSYGADDYIVKPFNPQVVKLRVGNLLRLTRKRKEEIASGKEQLNAREKKFLESFEAYVVENMSSPSFGIEEICRAMGLSRMQLYRKMTAITEKKPSQYIKEIKMKRAYVLIKEQGLNITETMYEVGHTNYTHFSHLFSEVNGVSPREVLGMKKN